MRAFVKSLHRTFEDTFFPVSSLITNETLTLGHRTDHGPLGGCNGGGLGVILCLLP